MHMQTEIICWQEICGSELKAELFRRRKIVTMGEKMQGKRKQKYKYKATCKGIFTD